ncbi:hypothetical protein MUK42_01145 [Musa troglodytarum]|uniref:Uncharacterized protein n=1 Tax=Musa troglodytarum TaxID=320322 RepID=A0A9E7K2V8_9LILI|nr:hypothetical protein MUK42_01145 [Musa troglodytarum]
MTIDSVHLKSLLQSVRKDDLNFTKTESSQAGSTHMREGQAAGELREADDNITTHSLKSPERQCVWHQWPQCVLEKEVTCEHRQVRDQSILSLGPPGVHSGDTGLMSVVGGRPFDKVGRGKRDFVI